MSTASNYVHLDVEEIVRETEAAFLLRLESGEEVWMPKSQIADWNELLEGDQNCTVSVTEFIAREKGLT